MMEGAVFDLQSAFPEACSLLLLRREVLRRVVAQDQVVALECFGHLKADGEFTFHLPTHGMKDFRAVFVADENPNLRVYKLLQVDAGFIGPIQEDEQQFVASGGFGTVHFLDKAARGDHQVANGCFERVARRRGVGGIQV
jgi:hypothetical protein